MSHKGIVVTISSIRDMPGKDIIGAASMHQLPGIETIVRKDYSLAEKYVYFPPSVQLSEEFCAFNDLVIKKDSSGKKVGGGYFSDRRRVMVQRFGGVRSEGIIFKLSAFSYIPGAIKKISNMDLGQEFDFIGSYEICRKYSAKQRRKTKFEKFIEKVRTTPYIYKLVPILFFLYKKWQNLIDYIEDFKSQIDVYKYNKNFQRHKDTEHLTKFVERIPIGAKIVITEKEHGTSARTAKLPDTSIKGRIKGLFKNNYLFYVGTRNVVLKSGQHDPFYGEGENFRWKVAEKFKNIEDGEDFSYEIVGYQSSGKPFFEQPVDRLKKDYKSLKRLNDKMIFSYGCKPGECHESVYKYSKMVNGKLVTQDWDTTVARCKELGLRTVLELDRFTYDGDMNALIKKCNSFLANDDFVPSRRDDSHLTEGICLRIDGFSWEVYKHKSFLFLVIEGVRQETSDEDENN